MCIRDSSYLESLEVDHASVWRAAGRLKGKKRTRHPLITPDGTVYSAEGKAEVFADCIEEQFTVHRGISDPAPHLAVVRDFLSGYVSAPPIDPPISVDEDDLASVLSRLTVCAWLHQSDACKLCSD